MVEKREYFLTCEKLNEIHISVPVNQILLEDSHTCCLWWVLCYRRTRRACDRAHRASDSYCEARPRVADPNPVPCFVPDRDLNHCQGAKPWSLSDVVRSGCRSWSLQGAPSSSLPAGAGELLQTKLCSAGVPGSGLVLCVHPAQSGCGLFSPDLLL